MITVKQGLTTCAMIVGSYKLGCEILKSAKKVDNRVKKLCSDLIELNPGLNDRDIRFRGHDSTRPYGCTTPDPSIAYAYAMKNHSPTLTGLTLKPGCKPNDIYESVVHVNKNQVDQQAVVPVTKDELTIADGAYLMYLRQSMTVSNKGFTSGI